MQFLNVIGNNREIIEATFRHREYLLNIGWKSSDPNIAENIFRDGIVRQTLEATEKLRRCAVAELFVV